MLHLELQPETEARITANAQRRGLSIAQLIEDMASADALDDIATGPTRPTREIFAELHEEDGIRG